VLAGPERVAFKGNKEEFVEEIRQALYASKIISYTQGFMLLREAAKVFNWKLVSIKKCLFEENSAIY
jgi:6-phosphogluconate dehydrogenase